jgi:hypothetical protein
MKLRRIPQVDMLEDRGWEVRVQVTFIAPLKQVPNVPGLSPEPSPRSNLVVSIWQRAETAEKSAEAFLTNFMSSGIEIEIMEAIAPVAFSDGRQGVKFVVEFPVTPDTRLAQMHLFRDDDDILTQIVVTHDPEVEDDDFQLALEAALTIGPPG